MPGRRLMGVAKFEYWKISALRHLNDDGIFRAQRLIILVELSSQPPRLNPDNRVFGRVEVPGTIEDHRGKRVLLEFLQAPGNRRVDAMGQEPAQSLRVQEDRADQNPLKLLANGFVVLVRSCRAHVCYVRSARKACGASLQRLMKNVPGPRWEISTLNRARQRAGLHVFFPLRQHAGQATRSRVARSGWRTSTRSACRIGLRRNPEQPACAAHRFCVAISSDDKTTIGVRALANCVSHWRMERIVS